ncbi:hypothetical protein [Lactobacillus delbrueckii]|uniref:hypothetical protein n=1 Tax=Lactobacillus delbrueckii TaxID=1584 RepID=UPI0025B00E0C|nr:hypothetical protein [Lactobacillus delbrueckii]
MKKSDLIILSKLALASALLLDNRKKGKEIFASLSAEGKNMVKSNLFLSENHYY